MSFDAFPYSSPTLPNAASVWVELLAASGESGNFMSPLELDGYLTGVFVAPSAIPPGKWLAGLFGGREPAVLEEARLLSAIGGVRAIFERLGEDILRSLRKLETERVCDYRPAYLVGEGKPSHAAVRTWARGFWRAMQLAPTEWTALGEDERTQVLIAPFVGFIDAGIEEDFVPGDDIEERLDEAASMIPRCILLLRKLAEMRAARPAQAQAARREKLGRNDPCACGSGRKSKRCCGVN
jgi:uncharacterized protein